MLNLAAQNIAGPTAVMNSFERAMIEPSLVRTLQRGGAQAQRINAVVDPMALVMGMVLWGTRVMGVRSAAQNLAKQGYAPPPASDVDEAQLTLVPNPNGQRASIFDVVDTGIG